MWDVRLSQWASGGDNTDQLLTAMTELARFHQLMRSFPEYPTRVRTFGAIEWFLDRLAGARQLLSNSGLAAATELEKLLSLMKQVLEQNRFPESFATQYILIDCHPGQFLFDNRTFTGIVDFDHVATGVSFRDLCKFLATDKATLELSARLVHAYLSVESIPVQQRRLLPGGIVRYIVTSAINDVHRALSESRSIDSVCLLFRQKLQAFFETLPSLEEALGVTGCAGVPERTSVNLG